MVNVKLLEGIEIARIAVEAATEKQAVDIVLLDVRDICHFADYFVICSAESGPQMKAISSEIEISLKKVDVPIHHREGDADSGWVLLDYGDVVMHIFSTDERGHYELDKVWGEARPVVRIQ